MVVRKIFSLAFMLLLSFLYLQVSFAKEDVEKEFLYLKRLSAKGFPEAEIKLGKFVLNRKVLLSRADLKFVLRTLKDAYRNGYTEAALLIAKILSRYGYKNKSIFWYKEALKHNLFDDEYLKITNYLSFRELKILERLAKGNPRIYLELGDYFYKYNDFPAALHYYQFAVRYGSVKAKLMIGKCLYRLGNESLALDTFYTLYKQGVVKAAVELGKIFESKADLLGYGSCDFFSATSYKDYLKRKSALFEKKYDLYSLSIKWFRKALPETKQYIARVLEKQRKFNPLIKKSVSLKKLPDSIDALKLLCRRNVPEAEIKLAVISKKRSLKFRTAVLFLYSHYGFEVSNYLNITQLATYGPEAP